MAQVRRRYYIWLLRAYIKKWKKTIFTSVIIGIGIFFALFSIFNFYVQPLITNKAQRIGYAGVFTPQSIPEELLRNISFGLTKVEKDGSIAPAAASKWEIKDKGKKYVFHLKKGQRFHNGKELTSKTLNLNFKDVKRENIDEYTVAYTLKSPYAPFLSAVSQPILIDGFSGLGDYQLKKLELNAGFVKTMILQSRQDTSYKKTILFYPTQRAVKLAFMLGEVNQINDVNSLKVDNTDLASWKNLKPEKNTSYAELVTLFYNNADPNLSNKKLRQALNYALPSVFEEGERAYSSIPPTSIYFSKAPNYGISDQEIAKKLLESSGADLKEGVTITTTDEYVEPAKKIKQAWEGIGVKTNVEVVNAFPSKFQILLQPFTLPKDPDQYTLWHSGQTNNIVHFKNLRIDKLLEDGREKEVSQSDRISIYADFQKYLLDEVPASFLYFPYKFTLSR